MPRSSWVYPSDGSAPYEKGSRPQTYVPREAGYMIMGDLPDFKSPVDGKVYSGRAGLREHNLRNNVVPVEDCAGLPYMTTASNMMSEQDRRASSERRKELIIREVNRMKES